jgi:putative peptide zinc metalloprotease protein
MDERVELRDDLDVSEKHENGDVIFLVRNPDTDETFEFGGQEWFILQSLDGILDAEDVIKAFSARYDTELTIEQFNSFITMISSWGLVKGSNIDITGNESERAVSRGGSESDSAFNDLIVMPNDDITGIVNADKPFLKRPAVSRRAESTVSDVDWFLFHPGKLLQVLAGLLSPLFYLRYLLPVLFFIACAIIFNNLQEFIFDFLRIRRPLSIIQILVFSMFTANIITQLGKGIVATRQGLVANEFGIKFVLGVIPRFAVNIPGIDRLPRHQKLDVYSSPLLIRLTIFSIATLLWLTYRPTGTMLSTICLMMLVIGVFSFILAVNPLYNSDGYKVLTTLLDMPNLRQKANLALFGSEKSPLADRFIQEDNVFALRAYALSSLIFMFVLLGAVLIISARWFELNYQGTGVTLYILLTVYLIWRLYSRFVTKRTEMKERRSKFEATMAARNNPGEAAADSQKTGQKQRRPGRRGRRNRSSGGRGLWWSIWKGGPKRKIFLILFIITLFLPYPYETGGVLLVLPNKQHEIYAETPGVIKEVLHKDGKFLKAGTIVATLSSYEQEKNLLTTQASILEQEAKLAQLRSTPTKEDIELAESRLKTARTQYKYTSESAKRLEALYKDGNVSLDDYQDEQKQMEVDRMQVSEAKANLGKVVAGPHPKEIEAAEFELRRLKEKLKFDEEEFVRTKLAMPMDGRIVTENLDHMIGQYLDEGDPFATVENDEYVRIQIKVPESDIADVQLGADARFKVWAYGDMLFYGQVSEIAPVALDESYGKVIAVTVVIPNKDRLLKSGMTGFGKVDGGTKLVAVAFTRMLVRFFTIEMWSWIP